MTTRDPRGPWSIAARPPTDDELTRRTERWLLWGLAGYGSVVAALMFVGGLRLTPDVLFVALALAAVLIGRTRLFLRDWLPFIVIFLAYELMRGIADDAGFPVHVADVAALEMAMFGGVLPTAWLQERLAPADGVGPWAVAAVVVYMLHFTGDHYVVDVLGGVAYAWAAYLAAPRLTGWLATLFRRGTGDPAPRAAG